MNLPEPGERFQERYTIDGVIADGGFARVYAGTAIDLERPVAVKILRPGPSGYDPTLVARFLREVRAVGALTDPHTLQIFDAGRTHDGLLFMVFEFLGGEDLSVRLLRGTMPEPDAVRVIEQVLYSLREAHGQGILHRDIKPANIRVYQRGADPLATKLLDFGIAKSIVEPDNNVTRTGMMVGTRAYMSPEQLLGEPLSPASDLYSVGLVLYDMVIGRDQRTRDLGLASVADNAPVSPRLRRVLQRLLSRDISARYRTANEVLGDLRAPDQRPSRPPAPADPPRVPSRPRYPTTAIVGVIAVGALAATGVAVQVFAPEPEKARVRPLPAINTPKLPIRVEPAPHVAPPPQAHEAAATGCGRSSTITGHAALSQIVGLERVEYPVYVPDSYDPAQEHPLVVLLHDKSMTADTFIENRGILEAAESERFILLAPNDDPMSPWKDRSDLEKVNGGISLVSEEFCLDQERIYAIGLGRGSVLAEKLACEGRIAAVATTTYVATHPAATLCPRPAPLISIQARDNPFAPVDGGSNCIASNKESVADWNRRHAEVRSCKPEPVPHPTRPQCERWPSCDTPFTTCLVKGGFGWPGMKDRRIEIGPCNSGARAFPYAEVIWQFFEEVTPE